MKALLFAFLSCCLCTRIERKVGDQPPQGKCTTFKWGGKTNVHWYACCNNCDEDPIPCDSKTYQSASSEDYCDECGKDNAKGDGTKGNTYACGGCVEQDKIMDKCTNKLRDIPGFCWSFIKCFEKKCKALTSKREAGADDTPDTCFNLKCETGETVDNCPIDCCGEKNPVCRTESGKCPPLCCSEPSCCSNSSECEENPAACSECEIKRCESLQKKPGSCTVIGTITSVTIVKQISKSACIAGVTYSYSENTVYLFLGCRAKFYICHKPCQHYSTTLRCESWGFQPASCGVGGTILKVAVAKKRSKSACVLGSSYNFSGNTLFVDGGCRADFSICYLPSTF